MSLIFASITHCFFCRKQHIDSEAYYEHLIENNPNIVENNKLIKFPDNTRNPETYEHNSKIGKQGYIPQSKL